MAERQGFEPWEPHKGSTVFETAPFDHSGTSPLEIGASATQGCAPDVWERAG